MKNVRIDILTNKVLSIGEGKYITDGPNVVAMEFKEHEIPNERHDLLKFDPVSLKIVVDDTAVTNAAIEAQGKIQRKTNANNLIVNGIPDTQPGQNLAIKLILDVLKDNGLI